MHAGLFVVVVLGDQLHDVQVYHVFCEADVLEESC